MIAEQHKMIAEQHKMISEQNKMFAEIKTAYERQNQFIAEMNGKLTAPVGVPVKKNTTVFHGTLEMVLLYKTKDELSKFDSDLGIIEYREKILGRIFTILDLIMDHDLKRKFNWSGNVKSGGK